MNETEQTTFSVPSPGELEQLTELHKAMGDYTRMRILWYLMQKDSCVSELAQKMEVTESAISHQLRALRIVRLVQSRKAGKSVIYSLQDEHIRWILEETYVIIMSTFLPFGCGWSETKNAAKVVPDLPVFFLNGKSKTSPAASLFHDSLLRCDI